MIESNIEQRPKLSICIVTYNHEIFIERCINSILSQEVDFSLEVVVSDDCSTDGTGAIVDRIAGSDARVKVLRRSQNIGATRNFLEVHNAAQGEYVAHLDGDDFALPGKLARQAAVLDADPKLALCGHRMRYVFENEAELGASFPSRLSPRFNLSKVIRCGMPVMSSSIMYRREALTLRSADFELLDWYIYCNILGKGDGAFIPEDLGVYRINANSMTSALGFAALQNRMMTLYERKWTEAPRYKSDFFASFVMAAIAALRRGAPITPQHLRMLRRTFSPFAIGEMADAALWVVTNRKTLSSR